VIEFSVDGGVNEESLAALAEVRSVARDGEMVHLTVSEPHVALPALLTHLGASGVALTSLTTRHASLEDVFVSLTGRHLRDGDER